MQIHKRQFEGIVQDWFNMSMRCDPIGAQAALQRYLALCSPSHKKEAGHCRMKYDPDTSKAFG